MVACPRCTRADLLSAVQREVIARSGIDPAEVGQVVAGCVSQVGEQSFNIARTAWLAAGLPLTAAATTVDTQCGSSQQATNLATSLVGAGVVDVAVACGVEVMSRIPIGVNSSKKLGLGVPIPKTYFGQYEMTSQFEAAERIADKWGISRADADAFGFQSQQRAARAWEEGRFGSQVVEVDAPDLDEEGKPTGTTHHVGARRGPARHVPGGAGPAQAGGAGERRAHGRLVVADLRRRRRRAADDRARRPPPSGSAPRRGWSTPAWSASTRCSC